MKPTIDFRTAWDAFQPSDSQPWTRRLAAHLLRRAAFGATPSEVEAAVKAGPQETVRQLVAATDSAATTKTFDDLAQAVLNTGNPRGWPAWWLYRMVHSAAPLAEQLTLLWHGHFATSGAKVASARLLYDQHQILRRHALGSFREMTHEIARDPAMLLYLDSATNRRSHPNENFARELMELFCLGLGKYTEKDIQELARCFTGWEVSHERFRFNRFQYDTGEKSFLGRTGAFDGKAGVDIVLDQPAVGLFVAGKLVRHFVSDELPLTDELLTPLAQRFRETRGDLRATVTMLLGSNLFFSSVASVGAKLRSPVELAVGVLRSCEATTNMTQLSDQLAELGQLPFYPPNVKGWPGGRAWINAATLVGRVN
ncbi:MAG TPA: DUF1800 domain-containing protein, partial [Pirellulaceae bacterium]|nr:DUF1800 domain-containing protein [Pirellulaceae bacterium]